MNPLRRIRQVAPVMALGSLLSCREPATLPAIDLFQPITDVTVYTFGRTLLVGDTARIRAEGFRNGSGFGVQMPQTVTFVSSDTTVFRVEDVGGVGTRQPNALVRAVAPGLARLHATLDGVTGSDTLRVVPITP
jgi:hypothetical protein